MTRAERRGWVLAAAILALALLLLARSVAAADAGFMPKGGRALLAELLGAPAQEPDLRAMASARRTEDEWKAQLATRAELGERERATLSAYLSANMPLEDEAARRPNLARSLPPDGRDIAWKECQACHSLFSHYLTQSRDADGWRRLFRSPAHQHMAIKPAQREEFARYSALNMPMKAGDVPPDLRH